MLGTAAFPLVPTKVWSTAFSVTEWDCLPGNDGLGSAFLLCLAALYNVFLGIFSIYLASFSTDVGFEYDESLSIQVTVILAFIFAIFATLYKFLSKSLVSQQNLAISSSIISYNLIALIYLFFWPLKLMLVGAPNQSGEEVVDLKATTQTSRSAKIDLKATNFTNKSGRNILMDEKYGTQRSKNRMALSVKSTRVFTGNALIPKHIDGILWKWDIFIREHKFLGRWSAGFLVFSKDLQIVSILPGQDKKETDTTLSISFPISNLNIVYRGFNLNSVERQGVDKSRTFSLSKAEEFEGIILIFKVKQRGTFSIQSVNVQQAEQIVQKLTNAPETATPLFNHKFDMDSRYDLEFDTQSSNFEIPHMNGLPNRKEDIDIENNKI